MISKTTKTRFLFSSLFSLVIILKVNAQEIVPSKLALGYQEFLFVCFIIIVMALLFALVAVRKKAMALWRVYQTNNQGNVALEAYLKSLSGNQIARLFHIKNKTNSKKTFALLFSSLLVDQKLIAQIPSKPDGESLLSETGVVMTLVLVLIPILLVMFLVIIKIGKLVSNEGEKVKKMQAGQLTDYLSHYIDENAATLEKRKNAEDYNLTNSELAGNNSAVDSRGLLHLSEQHDLPLVTTKKRALPRPNVDPALTRVILWFLGSATFWLIFGSSAGEYLGIKFVAPDTDQVSWLSFGRLRPVHTNAVFWGWSSLAMIGLGYYIVPRVGNTTIANLKWAWNSLWLINTAVFLGSLSLMAGINNGGGEYREYIWPIMLLFGLGIYYTLRNFISTVSNRKTGEIYISNWYIISSLIFITIVAVIGYLPFWQNGLGETITQGYYIHQAVGMWFMFFTLGIVYYFLPQQLNRPIYSYSLGILAFWTQILFYTLIGTHHFVFSAIPWWLQTVAIVASIGMVIPVAAGTTNFLMTFKGAWYKVRDSYTLPFFLVGVIFYFTGSLQGSAEAFRFTNQVWHFTDFTIAHSHMTMYGIITFFLWAAIYALVPRLTGKEAPQITIGIHFWLALIGLLFYTIPLMYGGTLRGLSWMQGKPFVESLTVMLPFWLWRAIGGTMMWLSHLIFAYNFYKMVCIEKESMDVVETAVRELEERYSIINPKQD